MIPRGGNSPHVAEAQRLCSGLINRRPMVRTHPATPGAATNTPSVLSPHGQFNSARAAARPRVCADIAQMAEQRICNPQAGSSSLPVGSRGMTAQEMPPQVVEHLQGRKG